MTWAFVWLGLLTLAFALHLWRDQAETRRLNELEEELGALRKQRP